MLRGEVRVKKSAKLRGSRRCVVCLKAKAGTSPRSPKCLQELLVGGDGQLVAAVVFGVAAVAGDPGELEAVFGDQLVEGLPQLDVGDGLQLAPFAALPAVALPACHPLAEALADVLA